MRSLVVEDEGRPTHRGRVERDQSDRVRYFQWRASGESDRPDRDHGPDSWHANPSMKPIICVLMVIAMAGRLSAIEVTHFTGAAHAYPAMWDLNGKKLASGEFSQEIQGKLLRIRISYNLGRGSRIEEQAAFQQQPELIQKEWSWREFKDGMLQRQYKIDFDSRKAVASKREKGGELQGLVRPGGGRGRPYLCRIRFRPCSPEPA